MTEDQFPKPNLQEMLQEAQAKDATNTQGNEDVTFNQKATEPVIPKVNMEETDLSFKKPDSNGSTVVIPKDEDVVLVADNEGRTDVVPATEVFGSDEETTGFVIEPKVEEVTKKPDLDLGRGVPAESAESVLSYMKEMDDDIKKHREAAEEAGIDTEALEAGKLTKTKETNNGNSYDNTDNEDDDEDQDEFDEDRHKRGSEVIVKVGLGQVVNFTDEDREKLEASKTIKLEEVETVEISSLKIKKAKKGTVDKVLERQASVHETSVVLLASGYEATMTGCSTYELASLIQNTQNPMIDTRTKWELVHSKLKNTSVGKMDFNTFLKDTAAADLTSFIYGIICSTYPDDDVIPMECPKCQSKFDHKYSVTSLIRAEKMSDKLIDNLSAIVDASHIDADAKRVHASSALYTSKQIKLPISGYYVEVHVQSAYDLIYNSVKAMVDSNDPKMQQAHVLSTLARRILVPDPDEAGSYISYDQAMDISKIIYKLNITDIMVLNKIGEALLDDASFEFGLVDVRCPNCGNHRKTIPFDLESILFYRYQQEMSIKLD